ncbi:MAG: hypothetical protein ACOC05_09640, partial [Oceanicaulis sp.]
GCESKPHNDVLVFGTRTVVGVDVSPSPQSGAYDVALGYRREEAVWMPLLANGEKAGAVTNDGTEGRGEASNGGPFYVGRNRTFRNVGGSGDTVTEDRRDAYSVFASLGAEIRGDARSTDGEVGAAAGLAQFFATGAAAQALAESQTVNTALAIQAAAAALARAEAAEARTQAAQATAALDIAKAREQGQLEAQRSNTVAEWLETADADAIGSAARGVGACRLSDSLAAALLAEEDLEARKGHIRQRSNASTGASDTAALNAFVNGECGDLVGGR